MHCPAEIAEVVLHLLQNGLLRARSLAWQGQAERSGVECDHIHNLPDLLVDYTPEKLDYYWNVERPEYIRLAGAGQLDGWEDLWKRLGDRLGQVHALASHS